MRNQECYNKDGKFLGWFSRSVAVVGLTFLRNENNWYVLASQRGEGTPDPEMVGKWNLGCGYLDFNETLKEAMIRETFEETGVDITDENIRMFNINSDPKSDKRQNLTVRFLTVLTKDKKFYEKQFSHKHNEKDEVGRIRFIPIGEVSDYDWAFNHEELIRSIWSKRAVLLKK